MARAIGLFAMLVGFTYLTWRVGWTLNASALWLAVPLLLAEMHGFATYLLYLWMTWRVDPIEAGEPESGVTVDFFIPTYNEPEEVLALTIAGAIAVEWPHETYVLDDGRRPWVKELCEALGARYLTREGNTGAKAGNINEALRATQSEFVAVVDADFVAAPDFLHATLGYFRDPMVAIVQAPQEFYNRDSFQHTGDGSDWNEQTTFYQVIQPGKNRWNAVFWCGSPSVLRRSAIEGIGGVLTDTVTEDLHTSIALHRQGWRIVFHSGVIARGIAPENYHAYILQRSRWAQGAMQVIRREWCRPGLTVAQRVSYVASTTTYFDAYRKFALLVVVPAILLLDQKPIDAPIWTFLVGWSIYFVTTQLANVILGRGQYRWIGIEMFDLMKMFAFIRASATLVVERAIRFQVTPKSEGGGRYVHPLMIPQLLLIGLYGVAIATGVFRLSGWLPAREAPVTAAALVWAVVVVLALGLIAWRTYAHTTMRRSHRQTVTLNGWMHAGNISTPIEFRNLSLAGTGFVSPHPVEIGEGIVVALQPGAVETRGVVRRVREDGNQWFIGAEFQEDLVRRIDIAKYLASTVLAEGSSPHRLFPRFRSFDDRAA